MATYRMDRHFYVTESLEVEADSLDEALKACQANLGEGDEDGWTITSETQSPVDATYSLPYLVRE